MTAGGEGQRRVVGVTSVIYLLKNRVDMYCFVFLGFSLDSGKGIVSKDEITFVSGAPRANHSGAVVLLKRDLKSAHLLPEHIFDGEGLASSFGYDVAVVDLNKDG